MSTYSSQPTSIPGREGPAPAPATGQPAQGAPPQEPPSGGPFGGSSISTLLIMLLPILLIVVAGYSLARSLPGLV